MLALAGEHADGTVLWMADERAVSNHVVPRITKAADNAGAARAAHRRRNTRMPLRANEVDAAPRASQPDPGEAEVVAELSAAAGLRRCPRCWRYLRGRRRGGHSGADAPIRRRRGVTDLSVRLLPIGENRDELVASKRRTREVISELGRPTSLITPAQSCETRASLRKARDPGRLRSSARHARRPWLGSTPSIGIVVRSGPHCGAVVSRQLIATACPAAITSNLSSSASDERPHRGRRRPSGRGSTRQKALQGTGRNLGSAASARRRCRRG